ncbi:hydroxyacid-oxoacid transhydrogenase [Aestuariirhabdus litorea]|uniref:hydroxyacid-oxoacid transhydrogenase n=1 Tax=Aestuariirhabdus litorea TaxID=2528527 RepID=A0A3P3VU85_9GAMM|nr:hydroxyacid-oxoacid transhydrogenase [Aestuariirhabdus litorea]RRJ85176.1 iron-containing alcohol dehydrogenase [Aestuariirhabdus litorea]RWW98398.1 iron-containing alcohol dehydrogenase [Endozoicomonadaceae bacterium GTF-13]
MSHTQTMEHIFTMDTSSIKYGAGATREIGEDMKNLGARRVMVVTDPNLTHNPAVVTVMESLKAAGLDAVLFDQTSVEPTDLSFKEAIAFATAGHFDGYVGVGGGSSMDTVKAANLYATYPAELLEYVNPPIGKGTPVPGPLKPMICVPTTAGTGSETTGVAIFDFLEMEAKTGIAHRALRPIMGIIDPDNTRTMPPMVAACTALDQFSHAIESITALPYNQRPAPESPALRPAYQGANPISHIWACKTLEMIASNLVRVTSDPDDDEARGQIMLAATYAGIGFGNSGVHLPHGMSYPVAGMVKDYRPEGYVTDHPTVPHGMAVVLNAPAVFRFTAPTNPELHLECARLMGVDTRGASAGDAGEVLSAGIVKMIRDCGLPNGLSGVGYGPEDVDKLVAGTLPQHRVTKLSPRPASAEDLKQLFLDSMVLW